MLDGQTECFFQVIVFQMRHEELAAMPPLALNICIQGKL